MVMYSVSRGEGAPLLLLHGFAMDHTMLLGLDPVFADGWRRVYVDLPGMGLSPAGPEIDSTDAVADAVADFIRDEFGDERFAILGDSFGGMLARRLARDFGDRVMGIALLCPVFVADHSRRELPELAPGDGPFAEATGGVAPDPAAIARIEARYELRTPPESIAFPGLTTVITGRQDTVVGYRDALRMLDSYPRATITVLDGAGHDAHLDRPASVAALLSDWASALVEARVRNSV